MSLLSSITRPCPHCGADYDITRRLNGDVCWCPCGKWFRMVIRLNGNVYLAKAEPPPGTEDAQETSADAALVAEMSALRAELEVAREDNAMLLGALREIDYSRADLPERVERLLGRIRAAEHPGRALMAALTRRTSELERERDAALVVVEAARATLGAPLFEHRQPLEVALAAYDETIN